MSINIVSARGLLRNPTSDPVAFKALVGFSWEVFAGGAPVCLICDLTWTSMDIPPPGAFAFVRPAFHRGTGEDLTEIVSGICRTCCNHSDLYARAVARYRELWPNLEPVAMHDAPSRRQ